MCELLHSLSSVDPSYVDGKLVKPDVDDIKAYWAEDSVAFLSGSPVEVETDGSRLLFLFRARSGGGWPRTASH